MPQILWKGKTTMGRSDDIRKGCQRTGYRKTGTDHTSTKIRTGAVLLVFLTLLCALLTGCGGGGKTAAEAEQEAAEDAGVTVRIGVLQIADSFPLYVAEQEGLFEKHGVDVEIIEFQSASDQSVAYEAGELDGMMTDMIVHQLPIPISIFFFAILWRFQISRAIPVKISNIFAMISICSSLYV